MTDRRTDWDDDRLAAAFAARTATRTAPKEIEQRVMGQLRSRPQRPTVWHPLRLVTAAGVLVALGLGVLVAQTISPRPSVAAIPSATASELQALGLALMTASEAAGIRDRGPDDRELAVHGWFRPAQVAPGASCAPVLRSPVNPALPQLCGETGQRIVEAGTDAASESTSATNPGASNGGPTAIRPLFPMLDQSALTVAVGRSEASGVEIVAVGHFDDRRSTLCGVDEQECRDTYVVDRLLAVDGAWVAPSTSLSLHRLEPGRVQPKWTDVDVDSLVAAAAPGIRIVSRLAIPGERIFEIEPALGTGAHGIVDRQLVWVVNGLEAHPNEPTRVGTILLIDGDPTVAFKSTPLHVSAVGFVPFPLVPLPPEPTPTRTTSPTLVVTPEVDFPETWLGLPVVGVSDVIARQTPDLIDDTAMFVRGWYIAPDPTEQCPALQDDRGPIEQPCPAGQHWLLEQPERLWTDPGAPWIDRRPTGPALKPIVLPDVPFDVPNLWFDTGPSPLPVVLLGHLGDSRSGYYPGVAQFVVDALVWRAGDPATARPWLLEPAVEDVASVMARVDRDVGPAVGTWLSVLSGAGLAVLHTDSPSELRDAPAVWIARSLLIEDGRPRVRPILTADGGRRVWSGMDLLTLIEVEVGEGVMLEITDGSDEVITARAATLDGAAEWITGDGPTETGEVMLGVIKERPNELRISWIGGACDKTWRLGWGAGEVLLWPREQLGTCRLNAIRREVVLTLDHPVDLEAIRVSNGGAGG